MAIIRAAMLPVPFFLGGRECLLLEVKRTSPRHYPMSAFDPKRTWHHPSSILEMQVHHSAQRTVGSVHQLL